MLFIDASMGIQKGEKVGLVGPNGAGKTTLLRTIAGEDRPDDGQVSIETGMTIGYFDQNGCARDILSRGRLTPHRHSGRATPAVRGGSA